MVDVDAAPVEILLHVGRVGHAAQLDDDVVECALASGFIDTGCQLAHGWCETSGARSAADAAILELHHLDAALIHGGAAQNLGIHVD